MLVRQGEARTRAADCHLAWSLAAIAGALDVAGLSAVGFYSSHMTGNVSSLADHVALGDVAAATVYAALVAVFISGAALSALLINAGQRRNLAGIYAFSILTEAGLLVGLGCADLWVGDVHRGPVLAFGLSFLMGLQNAVVTRISNARIRTTHVTGIVTDIGIELGNLADIRLRRGRDNARTALNLEKLGLHAMTAVAFLAGGVLGALIYRRMGDVLLFGTATVLALLALRGIVASRVPTAKGASA